ncbi:hypothetical protein NLX82_09645 [Paenibacillus sp. A3M_27_13]|nr:hypothetical protein [Paenibacillus sp. A3M_27_13]
MEPVQVGEHTFIGVEVKLPKTTLLLNLSHLLFSPDDIRNILMSFRNSQL